MQSDAYPVIVRQWLPFYKGRLGNSEPLCNGRPTVLGSVVIRLKVHGSTFIATLRLTDPSGNALFEGSVFDARYITRLLYLPGIAQIDERALPKIARFVLYSGNLTDVNLAHNVIRCNESEPFGVCILELLSLNTNITVRWL